LTGIAQDIIHIMIVNSILIVDLSKLGAGDQ